MHRLEKLYLTMALQKTEHGAAFDKNAASKSCLSCVLHKRSSTCLFELRFCQGLLSEEGMQLQGEPGSTSGILVESFGPKTMLMLGCLVQSALDVCMGWDLESPHLEEVS